MPTAKSRILVFDLLRGWFLCVIIIDHLGKFPVILDYITGRGLLWTSAAEGFFFLSGLMIGLVRGKLVKENKFREAWIKMWKRALLLYGWSVGLTLLFTFWGNIMGGTEGVKGGIIEATFWLTLKDAFLLHYSYGWSDFLPHYAVFLFYAPIALFILRKYPWWALPLLSFFLWLARGNNFNLAWQLIFFWGTAIGYYYKEISGWFAGLQKRKQDTISWVVMTVGLLSYLVDSAFYWGYLPDVPENILRYFDKDTMAPGRVLFFLLWFAALYVAFKRFEKPVMEWLGNVLVPFGQNSLYVYIIHSLTVFGVNLLFPRTYGIALNLTITLGVITFIWLLTSRRFLMGPIPK